MPLSSKTVRQEIMEANKILNQPVKPESKTKTAELLQLLDGFQVIENPDFPDDMMMVSTAIYKQLKSIEKL